MRGGAAPPAKAGCRREDRSAPGVVRRIDEDDDVLVILRRGAKHGGSADVDLLDTFGELDPSRRCPRTGRG